jgi:hypothetical protein
VSKISAPSLQGPPKSHTRGMLHRAKAVARRYGERQSAGPGQDRYGCIRCITGIPEFQGFPLALNPAGNESEIVPPAVNSLWGLQRDRKCRARALRKGLRTGQDCLREISENRSCRPHVQGQGSAVRMRGAGPCGGKLPVGVEAAAVTCSIVLPLPPATVNDENEAVPPAGRPLVLDDTVLLNRLPAGW